MHLVSFPGSPPTRCQWWKVFVNVWGESMEMRLRSINYSLGCNIVPSKPACNSDDKGSGYKYPLLQCISSCVLKRIIHLYTFLTINMFQKSPNFPMGFYLGSLPTQTWSLGHLAPEACETTSAVKHTTLLETPGLQYWPVHSFAGRPTAADQNTQPRPTMRGILHMNRICIAVDTGFNTCGTIFTALTSNINPVKKLRRCC